jgi:hypothetical protein
MRSVSEAKKHLCSSEGILQSADEVEVAERTMP